MFDAHYDRVWRVLRRLGLPPAGADDGAQQVFEVASQRLADIEAGKERAFLCATATRIAHRLRQTHARELPTEELPEAQAEGSPDEALERKQQRALLERVLASLDEDLRTVLVLAEVEGLSKREVAEALDIPEGTAASRLRRAREAFNEAVALHLPTKGGRP